MVSIATNWKLLFLNDLDNWIWEDSSCDNWNPRDIFMSLATYQDMHFYFFVYCICCCGSYGGFRSNCLFSLSTIWKMHFLLFRLNRFMDWLQTSWGKSWGPLDQTLLKLWFPLQPFAFPSNRFKNVFLTYSPESFHGLTWWGTSRELVDLELLKWWLS